MDLARLGAVFVVISALGACSVAKLGELHDADTTHGDAKVDSQEADSDAAPDADGTIEDGFDVDEPDEVDEVGPDTPDTIDPLTNAWRPALTGLPEVIHGLWGSDAFDVWFVGDGGLAVHGGPDGWRQIDLSSIDPVHAPLRAVSGNASEVWLVGDGGRAFVWSRAAGRATGLATGGDAPLYGVWSASEGATWAVGGDAAGPVLLALDEDVGTTNVPLGDIDGLIAPESYGALRAVWGRSTSDVWAVGDRGLVIHWNGSMWSQVELNTDAPFAGVGGLGGDTVIVGGSDAAVIYERRASMAAFAPISPNGLPLAAVAAGDTQVWAVGAGGQRFMRGVEETTWTDRQELATSAWRAVWIDARADVWVAGDGRLERFGPARLDLPMGPLRRVDDDVETVESVETVETSDAPETRDSSETADTRDTDISSWPFTVGWLSTDSPAVFTPFVDGQTVSIVHGPQGGFHVEIAVRFAWETSDSEVVAGLRLGLYTEGTRRAVYETTGYPVPSIGGGLFQTYVIAVAFDCVFSAAACQSAEFDGKDAMLEVTVEPPGRSWSGSLALRLDDSW